MFGVTTPGVNLACEKLAKLKDPATGEALYEPVVFHCTGSGGRSMERFITEKVGTSEIRAAQPAAHPRAFLVV